MHRMSKALLQQQQRRQCAQLTNAGARLITKSCTDLLLYRRQSFAGFSKSIESTDKELPETIEHNVSPSQPLALSRARFITTEKYNFSPQKDYRIYQNADLDAFFDDKAPINAEKVADICLLNDHYIFIKMPESYSETVVAKEPITEIAVEATPYKKHVDQKSSSKLPRCFKCNRSSRVSPIIEELDDSKQLHAVISTEYNNKSRNTTTSNRTLQMCRRNSNWCAKKDDIEIFQSRTEIKPRQSTSLVVVDDTASGGGSSSYKQNVYNSSLQNVVKLEQHGKLAISSNGSGSTATLLERKQQQHSSGFTLNAFHWLLRPFRRRRDTCSSSNVAKPKKPSKPKPKIHAAVHKTYFVRWTKPPETIWHGYGVDRSCKEYVNKKQLRRCRSSVY